jgi:hypothetical protein
MDEPTQQERYPMAGANVAAQRPGMGLSTPTRETEVHRELSDTQHLVAQLIKLSEELTQRLSAVISPRDDGRAEKETAELSVSTPLATTIRDINNGLNQSKKTLNFILSGLEL